LRRPRPPESLKTLFVLLALGAMLVVVLIAGLSFLPR
jgi:hypothetical protein